MVCGKAEATMASLTSVFLVMLGGLLCCGRLSYISSRSINHVEALPLSGKRLKADFLQPSSFNNHRHNGPISSDAATELADTDKGNGEKGTLIQEVKRLMGLFRCSGWGPSCSWSDYNDDNEPTLRLKLPSQPSSYPVNDVVGEEDASRRLVNSQEAARSKFQPFFTLTSGKHCQL